VNSKLRVLLVQLPVPNNPALNTPLAAGYLKAHAAAQSLLDMAEIEILPRGLADHAGDALLVDSIVARQPDVLGISLYTWNSERSLDIARRVKERLPQVRVVVGGPEVQRDNAWVLNHSAVDIAVLGEGEQTFAALLRMLADERRCPMGAKPSSTVRCLSSINGIAFRDDVGNLIFTPDRVALADLAVVPSPYLLDYLQVPSDGMLMVEVSRWCPYSCSFCLYGRNMGAKLGNRYFALERVLAEIAWGREHGVRRVHFVEANLNLVPLFWPLMHALADLNADHAMTFYAELRGEHLTDEVVAALDRANVRYVEVGLQTAHLTALKASHRRTDLRKWAAGTRRLYEHGIDVFLDVILGLPADDEAGVAETLEFIAREELGAYDVFTLQVLPGTAVRQQAEQFGLRYQDQPPYYVLGTNQLTYADLRRLRRDLKRGAGLDPDAVEGMPEPRREALQSAECRVQIEARTNVCDPIVEQLWLIDADESQWKQASESIGQFASHVDIIAPSSFVVRRSSLMQRAIELNPSTIFDIYLLADEPPAPDELRAWHDALPYQPGYLDRVAVYSRPEPAPAHQRVSPRCFLVLPWTASAEPEAYCGVAEIIWRFTLAEGEAVPFHAWAAAGGAGIALDFAAGCTDAYQAQVLADAQAWEQETGRVVWRM
jgi:radical SAM superfamily enzyme YgiQ (UPF0313 family)